jgi:hypothetical protein
LPVLNFTAQDFIALFFYKSLGMLMFDLIESYGHEQVVFCSDKEVGLKAIVAIHDTTLGPALGGTRMWQYASDEDAIKDALRLSRGMTYKAAVAGLNLGGGKAVIIGDSRTQKNEALFRAYGRAVEGYGIRRLPRFKSCGEIPVRFGFRQRQENCCAGCRKRSIALSGAPYKRRCNGFYY